jgi:hypothetical protein
MEIRHTEDSTCELSDANCLCSVSSKMQHIIAFLTPFATTTGSAELEARAYLHSDIFSPKNQYLHEIV